MGNLVQRYITTYNLKQLVDEYVQETDDLSNFETKDDYIITCPYCRDFRGKIRQKLYITKDYTVGHCWCCETVYLNPDEQKDTFEAPTFKAGGTAIEFQSINSVSLYPYEAASDKTDEGLEYLSSRPDKHLTEDFSKWGLRFTYNGVIYPITWNKDYPSVYYQIRYYKPKGNFKYFMPIIENKPFAMIQKGTSDKCIIVEGIYGGISIARQNPDKTVIAMLGKVLTEYHIWLFGFLDWIKHYTVFLDETELSVKFLKNFKNSGILYETLSYVESTGFDPDEFQAYAGTRVKLKDGILDIPKRLTKVQFDPKPVKLTFPTF